MGDDACISRVRRGPMVTYAANRPKSPMPSPTMPLRPIQNHWALLAAGSRTPRKMKCVDIRSMMAMVERRR